MINKPGLPQLRSITAPLRCSLVLKSFYSMMLLLSSSFRCSYYSMCLFTRTIYL